MSQMIDSQVTVVSPPHPLTPHGVEHSAWFSKTAVDRSRLTL